MAPSVRDHRRPPRGNRPFPGRRLACTRRLLSRDYSDPALGVDFYAEAGGADWRPSTRRAPNGVGLVAQLAGSAPGPSVTSSVAITVLWLFLFSASGVVNKLLALVGASGPNWFQDPDGVLRLAAGSLGITTPPASLAGRSFLGVSWWDWMSGPSVAMSAFILMAVFTTSGTFKLLFIAALQNLQGELQEAAMLDGATGR